MRNLQKELKKFFESKEGEDLIGNIVLKAVNQALSREIEFEDGKSEPGRVVAKKEVWNVLDFIAKYFPYVEGAIRGCQKDAASARNRAVTGQQVVSLIEKALHNQIPISRSDILALEDKSNTAEIPKGL